MSGLLLTRSADAGSGVAASEADDLRVQYDLLLASGGGETLWPDPVTGRTLTGSLLRPAPHEIWLSSTDTTAPSPFAHAAGLAALARLMGRQDAPALTLSRWFDGLRNHLARTLGAPGTVVFLAPGVAAGRDLARAVAASIFGDMPEELCAGAEESSDLALPAFATDIALRDECGMPRDRDEIDAQALRVARTLGDPLLIHVLDCSRSGLSGIARKVADDVLRRKSGVTLVDASAMRCAPERLRADLVAGRMVLVSGATFLSGPEACAALLLPASLLPRMIHAVPAPLVRDVTAYDLPRAWRERLCATASSGANIGLGLRWTAALAELDRYLQAPAPLRHAILDAFSRKVRSQIARCEWILPEPRMLDEDDDPARASIVPLILRDASGASTTEECALSLREALATAIDEPGDAICHVGAPIAFSDRFALPLSISAPIVSDIALRVSRGISFERAFAPLQRDLETLFRKIERVA